MALPKKKSNNDDLNAEQQKYYKKILMEEMIRKIERRVDEGDENVFKSLRSFMDETPMDLPDKAEKKRIKK